MFDLITIDCSFEYRSTFVNNQTRLYPGQGTMENINLNIQNKKLLNCLYTSGQYASWLSAIKLKQAQFELILTLPGYFFLLNETEIKSELVYVPWTLSNKQLSSNL